MVTAASTSRSTSSTRPRVAVSPRSPALSTLTGTLSQRLPVQRTIALYRRAAVWSHIRLATALAYSIIVPATGPAWPPSVHLLSQCSARGAGALERNESTRLWKYAGLFAGAFLVASIDSPLDRKRRTRCHSRLSWRSCFSQGRESRPRI